MTSSKDTQGGRRKVFASSSIPAWQERPHQPIKIGALIAGTSSADIYRQGRAGVLELVTLSGRTFVTTASLLDYVNSAKPWTPSKRGEAGRRRHAEICKSRWRTN